MKVIRQICYEGSEAGLRKQLSLSMPDGLREGWASSPNPVSIEVRTVYSELPELPEFNWETPEGQRQLKADLRAVVEESV